MQQSVRPSGEHYSFNWIVYRLSDIMLMKAEALSQLGTEEAYKVLCAIHGFNVEVKELWWDGENLTEYPSSVSNEVIGVIE